MAIVFMFAFTVAPALASDGVMVINESNASTETFVGVSSNTGFNWAGGSSGGSGGDGGDITASKCGGDVKDSNTYYGGEGGDASEGGVVVTGDASAGVEVMNVVNTNMTSIESSDGDGDVWVFGPIIGFGSDNTTVKNKTHTRSVTMVEVEANTGDNMVSGSYGGPGGDGGDIDTSWYGGDVKDSNAGRGEAGGDSGIGGYVLTGSADSYAGVVNILGTNITRIIR